MFSTIHRLLPTSNSSICYRLHLAPCTSHLDLNNSSCYTTRRRGNIVRSWIRVHRYLDRVWRTSNHYDNSDCLLQLREQNIFIENACLLLVFFQK